MGGFGGLEPTSNEDSKINVFEQHDVHLAFLYQDESPRGTPGPWLLRLEALEAEWFAAVWQVLKTQFGGDALQTTLAAALGGQSIQAGHPQLPPDVRRRLFELHLRYMTRTMLAGDPAPVGLIELLAGDAFIDRDALREGDWFVVEFIAGPPLDPLRQPEDEGELTYAPLGLTRAQDGPPRLCDLLRIEPLARLDPPLHAMLQALHFPQPDPDAKPGHAAPPGGTPGGGDPVLAVDLQGTLYWHTDSGVVPISGPAGASAAIPPSGGSPPLMRQFARANKRRRIDVGGGAGLPAGGGGGPPVGGAGGAPVGLPAVGGPPGGGPAVAVAPPLNPMAPHPGAFQPFVGANLVGAGNNIALYDRAGRIVAFVDYGLPTNVNINTYPAAAPDPCVCDDPLMVLSHWDYDHYAMVRQVPAALRRRWIAPQQVFGSVAGRELYVRLLVEVPNGAALQLWPTPGVAAVPSHLMTPFGFAERATGPAVNDDGIVMYVRVQDDPAAIPAAAMPPGFGARVAPAVAVPPGMVPGMVLNTAVIVTPPVAPGFIDGEWVDYMLAGVFNPALVAIAAVAGGGLAPPAAAQPAGFGQVLVATGNMALWIPPAGAPLPPAVGGNYVPSVPSALGWWAVSAADFVALGGFIVDFPPAATGAPHQHMMCLSPTPGSNWLPVAAGLPGAPGALPAPGALVVPAVGLAAGAAMWQPIWGGGAGACWAIPLQPVAAAAIPPLPGGPAALPTTPGAAPVTPQERYVVLPGDAGYHHLPALAGWPAALAAAGGAAAAGAVPLHAVGLVATHHGSDSWIPAAGAAAALQHIPLEPGIAGVLAAPVAASDKIVYSYGTRIGGPHNGAHCYAVGGPGHPRPAALAAYQANGWGNAPVLPAPPVTSTFHRLDTAPHDFESAQPYDPLPVAVPATPAQANAQGHLNGNVALGWDALAGGPLTGDHFPPAHVAAAAPGAGAPAPLRRICAGCAAARDYFF
ncbi:hypothetical protein [Aquabacterium humicola]|uniref:hypothetical protein n=1 Tax=Aquabacterium humicola TaxID=3237377 RepID=UPI002542E9D5|nr:hypothetical protein [Rubrivivax pictus]